MAFTTYQLSTELIDNIRTGYKAKGSKLLLAEKAIDVYDKAIKTSLRLYSMTRDTKYKEAAFRFAEKGKASVLSEALQETEAKAFAGIPDTLVARVRDN